MVYSTRDNRPVTGRCWWFWMLRRSKKVWFQISDPAAPLGPLLFRYDGRPILHCSELAAWRARCRPSPRPVMWRKWPEMGLAAGPEGSQLFLTLWSRWSWLHPEACGRPERFSVEVFDD
ncbi:MAG: hypothetical protein WBN89_00105 [Prochlorococcaceae cyanobacterium]